MTWNAYVNCMCMETYIKMSRLAGNGRVLSRSRFANLGFRT